MQSQIQCDTVNLWILTAEIEKEVMHKHRPIKYGGYGMEY